MIKKKPIKSQSQYKKEFQASIKENLNDIGILIDTNNKTCIARLVGFYEDMHDWGRVYINSNNETIDTIGFEIFINLKKSLSKEKYQQIENHFNYYLNIKKVKKLLIIKK